MRRGSTWKWAAGTVVTGLVVMAVALSAQAATPRPTSNPPWYPSLQAFEHYNSGRSHVFPLAKFNGSLTGPNRVDIVRSRRGRYPSGYNMSYLNSRSAFIQGGSYGDAKGSIGPFVAKVNPKNLKAIWYTQLRNTKKHGEWDYPGAMAIQSDGYIYTVSGYHVWKVNPKNGKVVKTLRLPTVVNNRNNFPSPTPTYYPQSSENHVNTSYNGLNALPDGTLILKSLYRTAGCPLDGPSAILTCNQSQNVPRSILLSVNPKTMKVIDKVTLDAFAGARPSISHFDGNDYVYLLERTASPVRYIVKDGHFTFDEAWQPVIPITNQTTGGSLIVMNDWIVGATNSVPSASPLIMFAVNQGNPQDLHLTMPYEHQTVPPELAKAFAPAISWAGMSLEADAENGIVYGVETLTRTVAAYRIGSNGFETVWSMPQTTTEWATLIGPKNHRVWVGTEIPGAEIPGANQTDVVVWRDAATGKELARSRRVAAMTQGSAIQPGYGGSVFFPGLNGTLYKLTPRPAG